jgi:hypothetical protein
MKAIIAGALCVLVVFVTVPAHADFKYTDTSKITGGSLKSMMKAMGIFSKQASQAMQPITTTHYIKGNRLRTDNSDGKTEIVDLDGRRVIEIDSQKRTYSEASFEEIKAAVQRAQEQAQQKVQKDPKQKNVNANLTAKVNVTLGAGSRQILGQTANEVKAQIDIEMQAQSDTQASGKPSGPVSGTVSTSIDSWVAPSITGYQEFAKFYRRMAQEINWVPPANIHVDARVSQSMEELQKNQAAFKGLPLLEYVSMSMAGQQGASATSAQNSNGSNSSSSSDNTPTSVSGAMLKGMGGLFGKKKKQDDAADQDSKNPPPPSTPGSLIEMTIEVTSFSDAALDSSLFVVPAGYTRVQQNPDQIIGKQAKQ